MQFNLSKWALENRSLVVYIMIAATIAGLAAFFRLGRDEDPPFVIKTMVVQAAWPGATLDDTLQQVTDRLERTLQETPSLDFLRSLYEPRQDDHLRQPEGGDHRRANSRHLVSRSQKHRRYAPYLAGRRGRPGVQRRIRRCFRDHLRRHRGWIYPPRVERLCRGYPLAADAGAGRRENRDPRRSGRKDIRRILGSAARRSRDRPVGSDRRPGGAEHCQPIRDSANRQ